MYVCMYVYVCMCMYMYVCVCICMYVSVCTCMYLYVPVCMCMCMYVYVCVCKCMYVYGRCRNYKTEVEEYEGTVIYRTLLFYNSVFLGRCEKENVSEFTPNFFRRSIILVGALLFYNSVFPHFSHIIRSIINVSRASFYNYFFRRTEKLIIERKKKYRTDKLIIELIIVSFPYQILILSSFYPHFIFVSSSNRHFLCILSSFPHQILVKSSLNLHFIDCICTNMQ